MKIAQINFSTVGSTGKIMKNIAKKSRESQIETRIYTTEVFSVEGRKPKDADDNVFYYGSFNENRIHNYLGKLFGLNGYFSYFGTKGLIKQLKKFSPDIIHLHNLHSHCIHLPTFFKYIRKYNKKVVWTLHDCWTFTGHCPNFDMVGCDKWKTGCFKCPQLRAYPKSYLDTTSAMYKKKRKMFTSVKDLILVTPSKWLKGLVEQSFLNKYQTQVINNGIDLDVFKPRESDFKKRYGIEGKFVILGVSFAWGERKGLDVFVELYKRLPLEYKIVLVGTDDIVDKTLPEGIISIHKTNNQIELAEIYSTADVFVNPTREENFPTVNIEALACGVPIITFDTGGSSEIIDENSGIKVKKNDVDKLEKEILRVYNERPFKKEDCIKRAKFFDMNDKFKEYIDLYENCTRST